MILVCNRSFWAFWILITLSACSTNAQQIILVSNGHTDYSIVIPSSPSKLEQRSAIVLQNYIQRISGVQLSITNEGNYSGKQAIYIGHTNKATGVHPDKMPPESSLVQAEGQNVIFIGG